MKDLLIPVIALVVGFSLVIFGTKLIINETAKQVIQECKK